MNESCYVFLKEAYRSMTGLACCVLYILGGTPRDPSCDPVCYNA